jgi:hypothetical protein
MRCGRKRLYDVNDTIHKGQNQIKKKESKWCAVFTYVNRLCGLVVSVEDYKHRGPRFDSWALLRIFLRELGLERGPLSHVIG